MNGVAVVVALPARLAREFPHLDEGGVGHRPHVTVLYLRDADPAAVAAAVSAALAAAGPMAVSVKLTGGVHSFEPSESSEGRRVAVSAVQSDGCCGS
jgi:hypothetical protein